jgi:hypothetical protein
VDKDDRPLLSSQIANDLVSLASFSEGARKSLTSISNGSEGDETLRQIERQLDDSEDEITAITNRIRSARGRIFGPLDLDTRVLIDEVIARKLGPGAIRDQLKQLGSAGSPREKAKNLLAQIETFNDSLAKMRSFRPASIPALQERVDPAQTTTLADPLSILREAIRAVPSVSFALGIAGVAAAAAIVTTLTRGYSGITIIAVSLVFVGMFVLFLFSMLVRSKSPAIHYAGMVLMWAVTLFIIIFMGFTTTAAAGGWPCNWAQFLGFHSSCEAVISPPQTPAVAPAKTPPILPDFHSDRVDGHHGANEYCIPKRDAYAAQYPDFNIVMIILGEGRDKDFLGHATYQYNCAFVAKPK